jgi:hypothetical protein
MRGPRGLTGAPGLPGIDGADAEEYDDSELRDAISEVSDGVSSLEFRLDDLCGHDLLYERFGRTWKLSGC